MSAPEGAAVESLRAVLVELDERKLLARATVIRVGDINVQLSSTPPDDAPGDAHALAPDIEGIVQNRVAAELAKAFGASS